MVAPLSPHTWLSPTVAGRNVYGVSGGFLAALASSNMQSVVQVTTSTGVELTVVGGSVSMDSTRDIGRTCQLEISPNETLDADAIFNLVRQPGLEITVRRGLTYDVLDIETGRTVPTTELVPLGVFSTDSAEQSKSKQATVRWDGSDRSKKISRNRFLDPYQIEAGTSLAAAGTALLHSRLATVAVDFSNVTDTVGANIVFEAGANSDPWKAARNLFSDYGYDLRFDGLGVARAVTIPDPATMDTDFDFGDGDTSLVLDGNAKASLDGVYNGVIATGEGTSVETPVRAEVWDTDPSSPTYYLSGFGRVPYFFSSPLLTTQDRAVKAATTLLAKVKGRFQKLAWPSIVNAALEPLDIVTVTYWGKTTKCVIDSLTVPLSPSESMSANARETSIT